MADEGALVSFDPDTAVRVARETVERDVLVVATYTGDDYAFHHVEDRVREQYTEDDDLESVADNVHQYAQIDFFERETFEKILPAAEEISAFATYTDAGIILRLVTPDEDGLFVSVDPGTDVTALVAALKPVVRDEE